MATEGVSHGAVFVTEADPNLQRRLLARDGTAQAELYHRFGPALHRFAAWRLDGDQDLAEEVVVEALVDAVKNIRRFNPRRSSRRSPDRPCWSIRAVTGDTCRASRSSGATASAPS